MGPHRPMRNSTQLLSTMKKIARLEFVHFYLKSGSFQPMNNYKYKVFGDLAFG
jgi:hypothetical protein